MAKILKFVFAIILFFSLFLLSMEAEPLLPCETDGDCPLKPIIETTPMISLHYMCIDKECVLFREVLQTP
uniref:Nodulin-3 n=2 Tax=Pisum sativum TaxID=3888 RepID=NO3_PEA|nr:RecName: Full=Nodulin-3; Short=N-3; Flags: Precursor [Pisum sativum]AAB23537.1 ENOD3 [Pisum sativum]QQO74643.1 nodule-specific cysteine-rich peptide G27 [Pisum sativum]